jgi:hypothetical protein
VGKKSRLRKAVGLWSVQHNTHRAYVSMSSIGEIAKFAAAGCANDPHQIVVAILCVQIKVVDH